MANKPRYARDLPEPAIRDAAPDIQPLVKSAGRVLRILDLFEDIRREARSGEIGERLGLPQSSTSFLLRCMVEFGYLDYDPGTRTYLPTRRVSLMGSWLTERPLRDSALLRIEDELSRLTGETIVVAGRNDIYAQYLSVLQATNPLRLHIPVGSRRLLVWSAAGFVLLRGMPPKEISLLVRRTNAMLPSEDRVEERVVFEHVAAATRDGYFFSRGLVTTGAGQIAVPLPTEFAQRGQPLVIAIAGWLERLVANELHYVHLIRQCMTRHLSFDSGNG